MMKKNKQSEPLAMVPELGPFPELVEGPKRQMIFLSNFRSSIRQAVAIFLLFAMLVNCQLLQAQNPDFSPEAADMYQNGMMALRMRRLSVARQQFKELIEKFPNDMHASMARRQMAAVMRDLKEYDQAIELLTEIIGASTSNNDPASTSLSDQSAFGGQSEGEVLSARDELLDILFELQRFKQGIELIEGWRKAQPQDVSLGRQLAKFYLQSGRKDEAWLLLEGLVETGNAPDAFRDLLELAVRSGEVEKLLQALESRRSRYRSTDFADYASDCHAALGRKDKAIETIMEVSDLKNHLLLLRKLADLQVDTGAIDNAVGTFDLILRILPDDWTTLRKMGHCRFVQNKPREAIEIWRRPLNRPYMPAREFYTEFTTVLIEHQLYDEALKSFEEARKLLQDTTVFSEEKASVLDALGRKEEALEEYLQVMAAGIYKPEVFEKLYDAKIPGFSLETRLLQLQKDDYNPAIMQALLEFYFRRADEKDIDKVVAIVGVADGRFDYAFHDRLKQEALLIPLDFHFNLTEKVMQARKATTLELMLASMLLKMAAHEDKWLMSAFTAAQKVVEADGVADADLKSGLLIDLARFASENLHDSKVAHKFIDAILQTDLLRAVPGLAVQAAIFKARIFTCEENFAAATALLAETAKQLPQTGGESVAMHLLESARLAAHSGDFQKALNDLKNIVENNPEGEFVNDALELALFITRRSIGDFDLLKRSLKAERLIFTGKPDLAADELRAAISKNASATALVSEMQADLLILRYTASDTTQLLKDIDAYATENPESFKTADLLQLKLRLQKKISAPDSEIKESLQRFVEKFPADLRSGKYRKLLANMGDNNLQK